MFGSIRLSCFSLFVRVVEATLCNVHHQWCDKYTLGQRLIIFFYLLLWMLLSCCIKIGTAEAENLYAALAIKQIIFCIVRKRFVQLYFTTALLRQMFHFSCNRRIMIHIILDWRPLPIQFATPSTKMIHGTDLPMFIIDTWCYLDLMCERGVEQHQIMINVTDLLH